jgi:toxin ParE1/3/4
MGAKLYKLLTTDQADEDLSEIMEWYEKERTGLGDEFLLKYLQLEDRLAKNPYLYQKILDQYRRGLVDHFPYSVWYEIMETTQEVEVSTITHQSRSMETIRKKLGLK